VKKAFKLIKRIAVIVAGSVVLLAGILMLVLPGPAVVVIPLGVAILGTEIPAARRIMQRAKAWIDKRRKAFRTKRAAKRLKRALHSLHPPSKAA
jgi:uncharacterized protein (TIGR02611 family)